MKNFVKILALALAFGLMLCACGKPAQDPVSTGGLNIVVDTTPEEDVIEQTLADNGEGDLGISAETEGAVHPEETLPQQTKAEEDLPQQTQPEENLPQEPELVVPEGEYNQGVILVKHSGEISEEMKKTYGFASVTRLYEGSSWYFVELTDGEKTVQTVSELRKNKVFDKVDFDYVMKTDAVDVTANPDHGKQKYLNTHNIYQAWDHSNGNKKAPGGSRDVVVAVIDTGVDYEHIDLRNNIWTNAGEIPDNGKDDDGNGYVDDVYGWDCVGNDNDPSDDNGHGTHVAGIIAAENNKEGVVGVAFGCRVMCVKAGNSSGYFNNSDIAEAIQYAYMNGASVINMSFGGSFISMAVEEALENAYNSCILVAAAGNDTMCNDLSCLVCDFKGVSYPAALPYVIGVMSCNTDGKTISSFSNYDHKPYDSVEYEVFAVGETMPSTWPGNKYATLNGTSMAAPTVSGVAALLRSEYADREVYSTKFIQSQIVNTGSLFCYNPLVEKTDEAHSVVNVYEAMTRLPKPAVKLYDFKINDGVSLSEKNNGNGVVDAGETIRLSVSLHNRGGVASNVVVTADVIRGEGVVDPYFTFVNDTIGLSDIGTYSVRESGNEKYFEIIVSGDCPNDYLTNINIHYTYENGLDEKDDTVYTDDGRQKAQFNVSSGYHLPAVIAEDTVYPADRLYIVGENVRIVAGATVTFEPGARIQFYDDTNYYDSPKMMVYGTLNLSGTAEEMITIKSSERYPNFGCIIENYGTLNMDYVESVNLFWENYNEATSVTSNSILHTNGSRDQNDVFIYRGGKTAGVFYLGSNIGALYNSYLDVISYGYNIRLTEAKGNYIRIQTNNSNAIACEGDFTDNIVHSYVVNRSYDGGSVSLSGKVENNIFTSADDENIFTLIKYFTDPAKVANNRFSAGYRQYAEQMINGYLDENGEKTLDVLSELENESLLYPHITSVEIFNADGEAINTIGKEEVTVKVTFSRPMDQGKNPSVTFGTIEPYADYKVEGRFVDELVWEGKYTLKAQIENGQNFLKVKNACDANDISKVVLGEYQLHEFTIDTTAAMAMSLFATATNAGIELSWLQDDYDTLMGYNIYRSEDKDGNFVKINPSVLTADESVFQDSNAVPGKTYWYTFTVVLSDFTESAPAGKVYCTAVDTLEPTVYHTPVNQGYLNNNLAISCTASDNMQVASVKVFYRTVGAETWKELTMNKVNDKYSAIIFGSELTLDGIEYYLEAFDGSNTVSKGSAEEPYTVVIKDASAISRKGDVDGDGVVTAKDALMIVQCKEGDLILSDDQFKRADLNGSGVLDSVEALRILQYINGNVPNLDM